MGSEALRVHERLDRAPSTDERACALVLRASFDTRMKSRFVAALADGREAGVTLARGSVLRDGDVLRAESGELIVVEAAAQPVLCISADSALDLLRVVYHLANRHVPAQIAAAYVLIEPDPVLAQMVRQLGATVEAAVMPFDPEPGAYSGAGTSAGTSMHGHAHDHHGHHHHADDHDEVSATVGEHLSIEAHRVRGA